MFSVTEVIIVPGRCLLAYTKLTLRRYGFASVYLIIFMVWPPTVGCVTVTFIDSNNNNEYLLNKSNKSNNTNNNYSVILLRIMIVFMFTIINNEQ